MREISDQADIPGLGGSLIAFTQWSRTEWALNVGSYSGAGGGRVLLYPHQISQLYNDLGTALQRMRFLEPQVLEGNYTEHLRPQFSQPEIEINFANGEAFLKLIFQTTTPGYYATPKNHFLSSRIRSDKIPLAMEGLRRCLQKGPELAMKLKLLAPEQKANSGWGGCFLVLFCLAAGLGLTISGCEAILGMDLDSQWWFLPLGLVILALTVYATIYLEKQHDQKSESKQPVAEAEYLVCICAHCSQKLEFSEHGIGTEIECPSCHLNTVLHNPSKR